jgi:hypothetical protein
MASEITWRHTATGATVYATIRTEARTMWYTVTPALEALTVAHWTSYAIALTETPGSSYFYVGTWPAALSTPGWYWVDLYQQAGGSPAIGDTLAGGMMAWWNGTTLRPQAADATQIGGTTQTAGDVYGVVAHADYGNAKLLRSDTPAYPLKVDVNGRIEASGIANPVSVNYLYAASVLWPDEATSLVDHFGGLEAGVTLSAETIDAIFDEALSGHTTAGTAGKVLSDAATAVELGKVPKSDGSASWNATAAAQIKAQAQDGLATLADINAEVDTALNTAIPGSPTADSINQRVKALDDLTQASGSGDLAAMKTAIGTPTDLGNGTATLAGNLSDIDGEADAIYGIVTNMGSVGSPTYAAASSNTLTTGNQTGGTYANTDSANQSYHVLTDAAGTLSNIYHFTLRPDEVASSITWIGRWNSTNDTLLFEIYDWTTPGYKTWFTQAGVNGTTATADFTKTMAMVSKYTGLGANAGLVNVRISGTGLTSCTLSTDQLVLGVSNTSRTVGYSDGAVWLNTSVSNTNTVSYVDGVADHPVTTIAAAITIADALGLKRIRIANGSAVTLTGTIAAKSLIGKNWTLALANQAITGAYIEGATISGTSSGTGALFVDCHFSGTQTVGGGDYLRCGFGVTTFTMLASSSYNFIACFDDDPDTANSPIFVFAASAVVGARNWRGAFQASAMASTNKLTLDGAGRLVLTDTSEGGAITLRGFYPPVTGGAGLHTAAEFVAHGGTLTQTSRFGTDNTISADAVAISGDTTAADRLEAILDATPNGTVSASPAPSATVFKTSLTEASDDHYNGAFCVFTSGALLGESRKISDYDGTDKIITTSAFTEAPTAGDAFLIIGRSE